jgi:hypothetical protein
LPNFYLLFNKKKKKKKKLDELEKKKLNNKNKNEMIVWEMTPANAILAHIYPLVFWFF